MKMWHLAPPGSPFKHRPPSHRVEAWHRNAAASAFAIARWEDDGGLVGGFSTGPDARLSTDGRMAYLLWAGIQSRTWLGRLAGMAGPFYRRCAGLFAQRR
jgi:hypothetical protein